MSINIDDSLIYASMSNIIPQENWSNDNGVSTFMYNNNTQQTSIPAFPITYGNAISYNNLTNILDDTTIKRACCQNTSDKTGDTIQIPVRLPLVEDQYITSNDNITTVGTKYGYMDKYVNVPKSICSNSKYSDYTPQSNKCDAFYTAYCTNVIQDYKTVSKTGNNPDEFNAGEFSIYKPECTCFVPGSSVLSNELINQPQCWSPNCADRGYRPNTMTSSCSINIQNCIQEVYNNLNNIQGNVKLNVAKQVANCNQRINKTVIPQNNTPGKTPSETSGETPSETSGETSSKTHGKISGETSGETHGKTSGETSGEISGKTSGETSGEISGETSRKKPGKTSGEISGEISSKTTNKTQSGLSKRQIYGIVAFVILIIAIIIGIIVKAKST